MFIDNFLYTLLSGICMRCIRRDPITRVKCYNMLSVSVEVLVLPSAPYTSYYNTVEFESNVGRTCYSRSKNGKLGLVSSDREVDSRR